MNIRPTHYVSLIFLCVLLVYYLVLNMLCAMLINQVNVPQPRAPASGNNVRVPSNVSMSVRRLCICY